MNRLCIFVFYDRDGKVDTYVNYLLNALQPHLKKLVIVCNGKLSSLGRKQLESFTPELFIRENKGYDAMAFKLAMTTYIGWEKVMTYDELLLINDTFYGPLYPLNNVFTKMDKKQCDFWGMTCHREYVDYYFGDSCKLPAHIQSYFMVFRKAVFRSNVFQNYWNAFDSTDWIFSDVVNKHERFFSQFLEQAGFSWDTYVHAEEYDEATPKDNFVQYYHAAYQLIKDYKCPIIKKKKLASIHLINNPGEFGNDAMKAFSWIHENTDYDTDMIWENLLRLYDMKDLQKSLNLNYVIEKNVIPDDTSVEKIMACVYIDKPLTQQQNEYLQLIKSYMDIWTWKGHEDSSEFDSAANNWNELCNRINKCEYVLLLIKKNGEDGKQTSLRIYSAIEEQWGNLIGELSYVESIIRLFSEHKRMGVLLAPCGIHGTDFGMETWQKLQGCLTLWCRKSVFLEVKLKWLTFIKNAYRRSVAELQDAFIYTAQKMGYYSAIGMQPSYAAMAYASMDEMLYQIEKHTKSKYKFDDFGSYLDGDMLLFCAQFSEIFVYGAGDNGGRAAKLIISKGYHFSGFIISDQQPGKAEKDGYPIYKLSEIAKQLHIAGVVVSVTNKQFQTQIMKQLMRLKIKNIYLLDI